MADADPIVVTGLGAVSALGLNAADNWAAARAGQGGIAQHLFDTGPLEPLEKGPRGPAPFSQPVALVKGDANQALEAALERRVGASFDAFSTYALKSAHEALAQAGLIGERLGPRAAVIMGNGVGGLHTQERAYEKFYGARGGKVHPMTVPRAMMSAPASAIAMEWGVTGAVFATTSACASSGHAIVQGAGLIASGMADLAIVGGSEAMATPGGMKSWDALQATSEVTCRPFSIDRDGMVIGEGGAAMVIERLSHAKARGATPIATLAGFGMSSDAFHWTQPSLEGPVASMTQACGPAGLTQMDQVLISAHGTGTPLNDKNESAAIHAVFGERAMNHPVIATKSAHGHVIGASAALQTVIALQALRDGFAPPVLNYLGPDPECQVNLVLGEARPITAKALLVNAFAFGGLNVSLAFQL
jgi:nodulation protein E